MLLSRWPASPACRSSARSGAGSRPSLPVELPDEDRSTDPAALRRGEFVYPCSHWFGFTRPAADHLLVDIFFSFGDPRHPGLDRPTLAHRQIVERYGGVILRSYDYPGLRVWFPTDSIPRLDQDHAEVVVRFVPEPRRYDASVSITFEAGVDFEAVSALVVKLGGRVLLSLNEPNFPIAAALLLPNREIPKVRALPKVKRFIYSGAPLCF